MALNKYFIVILNAVKNLRSFATAQDDKGDFSVAHSLCDIFLLYFSVEI